MRCENSWFSWFHFRFKSKIFIANSFKMHRSQWNRTLLLYPLCILCMIYEMFTIEMNILKISWNFLCPCSNVLVPKTLYTIKPICKEFFSIWQEFQEKLLFGPPPLDMWYMCKSGQGPSTRNDYVLRVRMDLWRKINRLKSTY